MVQNASLGVGALLRQRREELGLDADSVSRQLRIRAAYIKSIEDGRLQDLPGTAYAVGFVRTYADFLGFDGNSVVASYRDELAQRGPNDPVTWRMEERESYFPGGKLLVACIVLAGAAYGVWYYLSNTQSGVGLIESVPEYLKKGTGGASDSVKPSDGAKPAAETGKSAEAPSDSITPGQSTEPAAGAAATESTGNAATPPAGAPVPTENQAGTSAEPPATQSQAAQSVPGQQPAQPGTPADQAASGATVPQTPAGPTPTPPNAAAQADGGEAAPGVAAAAATTTTRIVIRAKLESWVQVMDKDNKPILSRVLRAGETYAVPDQPGLILNTGNAGGIEMVLDGKPLQSLGSVGLVRRNIVLDPEKLASGAAFLKTPVPAPASPGPGANSGD
ncbi:MAG: RodZ domain-containing protein [Dongiaceae bacterium]